MNGNETMSVDVFIKQTIGIERGRFGDAPAPEDDTFISILHDILDTTDPNNTDSTS